MVSGLFIVGFSNVILVVLPDSSYNIAVLISFLSRISEGIGCAFCMITSNTTLTSDYPNEVTEIVATIEIMSGLGLSAGLAIGSIIYKLFGYRSTCLVIGLSIMAYSPFLFLIIGKSKVYKKSGEKIGIMTILPRRVNQI